MLNQQLQPNQPNNGSAPASAMITGASVIASVLRYLAAPQPRQDRALVSREQSRAIRTFKTWGDKNVDVMLEVMRARLAHQNLDGSVFSPRLVTSIVVGDAYQLVILNTTALWHFDLNDFTNPNMLAALSSALHLSVRLYARQDQRFGLTYVVSFRDFPTEDEAAVAESARLPRAVKLDLGARRNLRDRLMVPLGMSAQGETWKPLADMRRGVGHALIVGVTGSGKTSWLHAALAALLAENSPRLLNVALSDPKRGELMLWKDAPHLWRGDAYACEPKDIRQLLGDIVDEMNHRGDLRAGRACQTITTYNEMVEPAERLPYLLVVVDEFLDLSDDRSVIASVNALARRARSEGIFLWLASHSATALNGLPGPTKANLSTRIVFRLDMAQSGRALGCSGAHEIPRSIPGRMLVRVDGAPQLMQGFFLTNAEIVAIAQTVAGTRTRNGSNARTGGASLSDADRKLLTWALQEGRGYLAVSDIQRIAGVGHREARRVAEHLAQEGWLEKDSKSGNKRRVTQKFALLLGAPTQGEPAKPPNLPNLPNRQTDPAKPAKPSEMV